MQLVPNTHPAYKPLVLTLRGRWNSHPLARPVYQSDETLIELISSRPSGPDMRQIRAQDWILGNEACLSNVL